MAGCLLVGGGIGCLALLPQASALWTIPPQLLAGLFQRPRGNLPKHEQRREHETPTDNLQMRQVWIRHCGHGRMSLHALELVLAGAVPYGGASALRAGLD